MDIKEIMLKRESSYSKYAAFDKDSIRIKDFTPDIRPNYFRDIDRIIHTKSYTRYMDKTQVFSFSENDNVSKRMLHVQLVSKIARTIGRALSLNEDLIEAIALGHDLGHTPFGHVGEHILNKLSLEYGEGNFMHNVQSVRILMVLENQNISIQVLDGILCHNGEFIKNEYYPKPKTPDEFMTDYNLCYQDKEYAEGIVPMTLEGCVVRISDIIGYIGRDIEDAIELDVLGETSLPEDITNIVGNSNKDIINNIILDIIENSLDKPYIKLSDKIYNAIFNLKKFNYENIYYKANSKEDIMEYESKFRFVFEKCLYILKNNLTDTDIYQHFLNKANHNYLSNTSSNRKIIDYISGMTDDYFMNEYKELKSYQF